MERSKREPCHARHDDLSWRRLIAVSTHFTSPSIISPRSVRYQRAWNLPRYGPAARKCRSAISFGRHTSRDEGGAGTLVFGQRLAVERIARGTAQTSTRPGRVTGCGQTAVGRRSWRPRKSTSSLPRSAPKNTISRRPPSCPPRRATSSARRPVQRPFPKRPCKLPVSSRTLEAGHEFRVPILPDFVERQCEGPIDQTRDAQFVLTPGSTSGCVVVLQGEELIARRERAVDATDVEHAHELPDGLVEKFSGISANGTGVSSCASAGRTHSGRPSAARAPAATPPLSTARRVIGLAIGLGL